MLYPPLLSSHHHIQHLILPPLIHYIAPVCVYCIALCLVAEVGEVIAEGEDDFGDFAGLLASWIMCHNNRLFSSNTNHSLFSLQKTLSSAPTNGIKTRV